MSGLTYGYVHLKVDWLAESYAFRAGHWLSALLDRVVRPSALAISFYIKKNVRWEYRWIIMMMVILVKSGNCMMKLKYVNYYIINSCSKVT